MKTHRDLDVWKKSVSLVTLIYDITKGFPKEEIYGLTNQIRRAAVSVPSNIAEGQQRNSTKEFINFLSIAKGSNAELQTQLMICVGLHYLSEDEINTAMQLSNEVGKMLNALIDKLRQITNH